MQRNTWKLPTDKDSPLRSWREQVISGSAVSVLEGMQGQMENPSLLKYARVPRYLLSQPGFATPVEINTTDISGIDEAVAAAHLADVAVVLIGENCFQSAEGRSVSDLKLKGLQGELLQRVLEVNSDVVVVLMNGRPLNITGFVDRVPSVLVAWHPGSQAGHAIADVLFGTYNPSGKLPVSWPRAVGQLPIYYNHKNTGRPSGGEGSVFWPHYTDLSKEPLFPLGYGLSYTQFEYSDLVLDRNTMGMEDSILVRATVTRPVKKLKGLKNLAASCEEPSLRARQPIFDPEIIPKVLAYPEVELRRTVAKRSSTESMRERDSGRSGWNPVNSNCGSVPIQNRDWRPPLRSNRFPTEKTGTSCTNKL